MEKAPVAPVKAGSSTAKVSVSSASTLGRAETDKTVETEEVQLPPATDKWTDKRTVTMIRSGDGELIGVTI